MIVKLKYGSGTVREWWQQCCLDRCLPWGAAESNSGLLRHLGCDARSSLDRVLAAYSYSLDSWGLSLPGRSLLKSGWLERDSSEPARSVQPAVSSPANPNDKKLLFVHKVGEAYFPRDRVPMQPLRASCDRRKEIGPDPDRDF